MPHPNAQMSSGHRVGTKETEPHFLPSFPLWGKAVSHFPFSWPHLAVVEDEGDEGKEETRKRTQAS